MSEENDLGPVGFMWTITPFCPYCDKNAALGVKMEIDDGDECAGTSYGHYVCPNCNFKITVGIDEAGPVELL
jgi:hypothetical protein